MRVKSVVLDGFKSYAHRRELEDLSPHFNAITGLNGSGKSNIFDAICFVMGITNLKRMRADDPRELIFRGGTTGVHAARVTIEFINDDPATAPPGYSCEQFPIITVGRQIKLGGKQQFFLNNTVSMQSRVKRFFESISLNVDNPHFMVLQGTVHKLIGMRSADMLSLIEEAVGTKAFDHRRRTAEALIRNKEKKIEDIDDNIQHQIRPMVQAMKADQEAYQRYLQITEGLAEKLKFRRAYDYWRLVDQEAEADRSQGALRERVSTAKAQLQDLPLQEEQLTRKVMTLQESLQGPCEDALHLHEDESAKKKERARIQGEEAMAQKRHKELQKILVAIDKEAKDLVKAEKAFEAQREAREALTASIQAKRKEIQQLQRSLELLQSGVRAGASGLSLEAEKQQLEVRRIQLEAALKREEESLEDLQQEINEMEKRGAHQSAVMKGLKEEIAVVKKQHSAASELYKSKVLPLLEQQERHKEQVKRVMGEVEKVHEQFQRECAGKTFELAFDRRAAAAGGGAANGGSIDSHILGRVGELLVPKDAKYGKALVVGAQQQLLRVVVDHDSVAERIIQAGLRQRTSFLPLNRLEPPPVRPHQKPFGERVEEAKRLAKQFGGEAFLAKDLVKLRGLEENIGNEEVQEAAHPSKEMLQSLADVVFGQFLVCSSLSIAEQLAYHPSVRIKAVSLDGEVAEPHGIMTGGSSSTIRNIFVELEQFRERKKPLLRCQAQLHSFEAQLSATEAALRDVEPVFRQYRESEERWGELQQRWQGVGGGAELEARLDEKRAQQVTAEKSIEALRAELTQLLTRRDEIKKEASVDVQAAQKDLKAKLKAAESALAKMVKEEEHGALEFDREVAEAEERASSLRQRREDTQAEVQQTTEELQRHEGELRRIESELKPIVERLEQIEATRRSMEKEIEEGQEDLSQLQQRRHTLDTIVKNAEFERQQQQRQLEELRRQLRETLRQHPWLEGVKGQLGDASGPFYFSDEARTKKTLEELAEAEAHSAMMSMKVQRKSSNILYEDRKREYEELLKQREALGQDKIAIQNCIKGIQDRKWKALDRMVGVVSSIFGKLFSTCLPGASAELKEERDELNHLCGLGVRVVFNGKAKESLSELSGGQRSLLALCLLLAILRVRQAPIYILDEVDAALDPSHTQNIGLMLHTYFPTSQFLLVSLKDGMFSNADVLYHVRNTQGYSEITRVANSRTESRE